MLALNSGTISASNGDDASSHIRSPGRGPRDVLAEEEDSSKLCGQGFAWGHAQGETSKAVLEAR